MYKSLNNLSPPFMKIIFPEREITYNLRNRNQFRSRNVSSVFNGTETLSYRGPKTWSIVPGNIKKAMSLVEFKTKIMLWEPKDSTRRLCKTYVENVSFID